MAVRKRSQAEIDYYAALDQGQDPELTQAHLDEVQAGTGARPSLITNTEPDVVKPEGVWGGTHFTGIKPPQDAPQEVHDQWAAAINQPFDPISGEVLLKNSLLTKRGASRKSATNVAAKSGAIRRSIRSLSRTGS